MPTSEETSARRVHALLAAALDDPGLLAQWRRNRPAVKQAGAAALDLDQVRLFSGLVTKVRQTDVRYSLPLTFKLMDVFKISIEVFASYAEPASGLRKAGKKSKAEKILALSEFLDGWLDHDNRDHALIRDIIRHERALIDLRDGRAAMTAQPDTAIGPRRLSVRSVPLRCVSVTHHEMSCNPLELAQMLHSSECDLAPLTRGQFFYLYRWDDRHSCVSVDEIDELGFALVDLADGTHSLTEIAVFLREVGVALKAEDLRGTVRDMIDNGILTLGKRSRVHGGV